MIELELIENDSKGFQNAMNQHMEKPIKHLERELVKIRTGRAHTNMVEDLPVSCYGQAPVSLKTMAALTAPEVRLIVIQPWDPSIITEIEKAIAESDLGITPINDGKLIRLVLPETSTDRRQELKKILGKRAEEAKVAARGVRKEFNNLIRDAKKNKVVSENFYNRLHDLLQEITDTYIKKIDEMAAKKEKALSL